MTETHKRDGIGMLRDDVDTKVVSEYDRKVYTASAHQLSQLPVPVLLSKENSHDLLLFVLFDGTGNDVDSDREHATSVGIFRSELERRHKVDSRVNVIYLNGPGTQDNRVAKALDGALGYTFDDRIEWMYKKLMFEAKKFLDQDPEARISIVNVGFSRGAELASRFSRIVHERGIQNIDGMVLEDNVLRSDVIRFTKPPAIEPGRIPQAVALFDPVGTGLPHDRDRHLPSSVVAGFQIVAHDERRNLFPSSRIIWPGMSADRRFLSVENAGSHSDIGGSYHVDGLAIRNRNLMATFINAMSDEPLLKIQPENWDPSRDVIHDSSQHMLIYRTSHYTRHGERDVVGAQESAPDCRKVTYCQPPDPLDPALLPLIGERRLVGDQPSLSNPEPEKAIAMDRVQKEVLTSEKSMAEVMAILNEKDPARDARIDFRAFQADQAAPSNSAQRDTSIRMDEAQAGVTPRIIAGDDRSTALLRQEQEAMAFIEALRQHPSPQTRFPMAQEPPEAHPRNDPRNDRHPDYGMYRSIYSKLGEINAKVDIDLSKDEMERTTSALLVEAKRNQLSSVTHMHFGEDEKGRFMPIIHLKEAFHGDVDDPRTRWAAVDATKAIDQPIERSLQQLDDVNQGIQQHQLMREAELSQQQGMGMSMNR